MSDDVKRRGPGRPRKFDHDAIRAAYAAEPGATYGQIAQKFGCNPATVAKAVKAG